MPQRFGLLLLPGSDLLELAGALGLERVRGSDERRKASRLQACARRLSSRAHTRQRRVERPPVGGPVFELSLPGRAT